MGGCQLAHMFKLASRLRGWTTEPNTHTHAIYLPRHFIYLSTARWPAWLAKGVDASQQTNVFKTICMHHTHTRTFVRDCGTCADWSESRRDRECGGPGQETEEAEPNHRSPHCPPEHALAQCDPLSPRAVIEFTSEFDAIQIIVNFIFF